VTNTRTTSFPDLACSMPSRVTHACTASTDCLVVVDRMSLPRDAPPLVVAPADIASRRFLGVKPRAPGKPQLGYSFPGGLFVRWDPSPPAVVDTNGVNIGRKASLCLSLVSVAQMEGGLDGVLSCVCPAPQATGWSTKSKSPKLRL